MREDFYDCLVTVEGAAFPRGKYHPFEGQAIADADAAMNDRSKVAVAGRRAWVSVRHCQRDVAAKGGTGKTFEARTLRMWVWNGENWKEMATTQPPKRAKGKDEGGGDFLMAKAKHVRTLTARLSSYKRWVWTIPACVRSPRPKVWHLRGYDGEQLCLRFVVPDAVIGRRRTIEHRVLTKHRRHRGWLMAYQREAA